MRSRLVTGASRSGLPRRAGWTSTLSSTFSFSFPSIASSWRGRHTSATRPSRAVVDELRSALHAERMRTRPPTRIRGCAALRPADLTANRDLATRQPAAPTARRTGRRRPKDLVVAARASSTSPMRSSAQSASAISSSSQTTERGQEYSTGPGLPHRRAAPRVPSARGFGVSR